MDFFSQRISLTGKYIFLPYAFNGDWTEEEKAAIIAAISPHVPEEVDSMFNNWTFIKYARTTASQFVAERATWTQGSLIAGSVEELAKEIAAHYK